MRLICTLLAGLVIACPGVAMAQAVLQGGPWQPGHVPMYVGQGTQPIVQDSGPASGGAVGIGLNELLLAARGSGTPPYANAGTGPYNTNFCDYDAPKTSAGGYHYLCFSPNSEGSGLITYGASNAAPNYPLTIRVNGSDFSFPPPALTAVKQELIPVTSENTLSSLSIVPNSGMMVLYVNGQAIFPLGANPPFTRNGANLTWSAANAGYALETTDTVVAVYTY